MQCNDQEYKTVMKKLTSKSIIKLKGLHMENKQMFFLNYLLEVQGMKENRLYYLLHETDWELNIHHVKTGGLFIDRFVKGLR